MKKRITIRLDEDILEYYKTMGKNYQSVINVTLRECMSRSKETVSEYKKNSSEIRKYKKPSGERVIRTVDDVFKRVNEHQVSNERFFRPMPKKGKK